MQNMKRRVVLTAICTLLCGIVAGAVGYRIVCEFYIAQKAKASYALALENLDKRNPYGALVLFSMSAGIKENYEAYYKIGTIFFELGLGQAAAAMLENSLTLLDRKEMLITLEASSLMRMRTKIKDELEKAKTMK